MQLLLASEGGRREARREGGRRNGGGGCGIRPTLPSLARHSASYTYGCIHPSKSSVNEPPPPSLRGLAGGTGIKGQPQPPHKFCDGAKGSAARRRLGPRSKRNTNWAFICIPCRTRGDTASDLRAQRASKATPGSVSAPHLDKFYLGVQIASMTDLSFQLRERDVHTCCPKEKKRGGGRNEDLRLEFDWKKKKQVASNQGES